MTTVFLLLATRDGEKTVPIGAFADKEYAEKYMATQPKPFVAFNGRPFGEWVLEEIPFLSGRG